MSVAMQIVAEWLPDQERMVISFVAKGKTYVERLTREEWMMFIDNLDHAPLRIGGLNLVMKGDENLTAAATEGIKHYLRSVDYAFQRTGSTDFLKGEQ